ncbi:hypothetical protein COI97_15985 [Bacillus cereus]|nr:hypothetical protein COI97_15985 [Bacillus cereus]
MKIEVGDTVNTAHHKNVIVEKIDDKRLTPLVYFYSNEQEAAVSAWLSNCTLVKKREKKMETYTGIEAYKALQEGKVLEFAFENEFVFSIGSDNLIKESKKGTGKWKYSEISMNFLMTNSFVEYKELLKYKVGDEVWVKATVHTVDEEDRDTPYEVLVDGFGVWIEENEVKGIDE